MADDTLRSPSAKDVRKGAKAKAATDGVRADGSWSFEETQRVLEKMRVRQIGLETQNDKLRRAQGEMEAAREKFVELYDLAPVGY